MRTRRRRWIVRWDGAFPAASGASNSGGKITGCATGAARVGGGRMKEDTGKDIFKEVQRMNRMDCVEFQDVFARAGPARKRGRGAVRARAVACRRLQRLRCTVDRSRGAGLSCGRRRRSPRNCRRRRDWRLCCCRNSAAKRRRRLRAECAGSWRLLRLLRRCCWRWDFPCTGSIW